MANIFACMSSSLRHALTQSALCSLHAEESYAVANGDSSLSSNSAVCSLACEGGVKSSGKQRAPGYVLTFHPHFCASQEPQ